MPSTFSTNLGIELITTGEQAGTWGATTNTNLGTLIEQAISGYVAQVITDGADTVITIPSGSTGVARNMTLELTGALSAARNLIVPSNRKLYFIYNNTTGGYAVTVKVSGQTGVSVPNGAKVLLVSNGTDVVSAVNYIPDLYFPAGTAAAPSISTIGDTNTGIYFPAADKVAIATGGTQRVIVDDLGNVGIGTSSPDTKLTVTVADTAVSTRFKAVTGVVRFRPYVDTTLGAIIDSSNAAESAYLPFTLIGSTLRLFGGGGTGATIDSSGNLGLGVTPSAWNSATKNIQNPAGALFSINTTDSGVSQNLFLDSTGTWKYVNTAAASYFVQSSGSFAWASVGSGTAGATASLTTKMTLDASGNLGVGTSAAVSSRIHAEGNGVTIRMKTTGAIGSGSTCFLQFDGSEGDSGYFGFGGTANFMDVWNRRNGAITFGTNNTERARIDSSGNLLVGTTATLSNGRLRVSQSGTAGQGVIDLNHDAASGTRYLAVFYVQGERGSITSDGSVVAYNTSSDYRLKDNPQPLTGSGAFIDALQPKTWDWKTDGSRGVGFIAHEVQAVSPSSVVGTKDAVDAEGKPVMQAMEYGSAEFIANIIAELQSLRARVAALESN